VDWRGVDGEDSSHRVSLPTYPFDRQRFWLDRPLAFPSVQWKEAIERLSRSDRLTPEEILLLPKLTEILLEETEKKEIPPPLIEEFYRVEWRQQPLEKSPTKVSDAGLWLIFADRQGVALDLIRQLQTQGQDYLVVYPGEPTQAIDRQTQTLDPQDLEGFDTLFRSLSEGAFSTPPLTRIVHFWSVEEKTPINWTGEALSKAIEFGTASVLHLIQAYARYSFPSSPDFWLITRDAIPVTDTSPSLTGAPLWGLARVIALEYPRFWGGIIDLDSRTDRPWGEVLRQEILGTSAEDQIAFRGQTRYLPRLVRVTDTRSQKFPLSANKTYLITGGFGALGQRVARWMVERGARHLVLVGRTSPSGIVQEQLTSLQKLGATVTTLPVDISKENEFPHAGRVFRGLWTRRSAGRGICID
jgi:acyl transferase domain-containing protein